MMTRECNGTQGACLRGLLALGLLLASLAAAAPGFAQQPSSPAAAAQPAPVASPAPVPSAQAPSAPVASAPTPAADVAPAAAPSVQPRPAPAQPASAEAHPSVPAPSDFPALPPGHPALAGTAPAAGGAAAPAAEASAPNALLPHDLSPWGMFMAADWIVKAVMIGLAFASVVTWTVWLAKSIELMVARRQVARTLAALRGAASLQECWRALPARGPGPALVRAALAELEASRGLPAEGVRERVAIALSRIEAGAGRRMTMGTGFLATIGATAPFVGLFGTVWGIMNSFIGISKAQTTNLAVVAPGIAEALLATAIGLVAAIPAVVIYNVFARAIAGYRASLADASSEVMRHLSRDLDRAEARGGAGLRAAAE